ncbi:MAG TPA: hypothetical protein VEU96_15035 [Bryobacteraceae bacterium]|nr:hypothetical protein [Bryobacteraceae bacterium]
MTVQRGVWTGARVLLVILTLTCAACGRKAKQQARQAEQDAQSLSEFNHRIQDFVKMHQNAEPGIPHITASYSGEEIVARQHTMAARIVAQRAGAMEGNIFTPAIRPYFERAINSAYAENEPGIQASLECITPVDEKALTANAAYPENVSYAMTPPTILLHIPKLPPELEYRIVNRDLLLRDVEANLIVDIMRNAIRPVPGRRICDD